MTLRKKYGEHLNQISLSDRYKMIVGEQDLHKLASISRALVLKHQEFFDRSVNKAMDHLAKMPASVLYDISVSSGRDDKSLEFKWIYTLRTKCKSSNSYRDLFDDRSKIAQDSAITITLSACDIQVDIDDSTQKSTKPLIYKIVDDLPATSVEADVNHRALTPALSNAVANTRKDIARWIATYCRDHAALFFMDHPHFLSAMNNDPKAQKDAKGKDWATFNPII